ncbi:hypothetical protein HJ588_04420 [Flexivirga sp. ID2601S]|uniref:Asp23/Gls24 family envelope stress response protein n=1 Tax=Flexivirga aerilata TaxID=1656889 RepID=A0A849AJE1_9MICO|nr:hypothetical protein [Flexivirga aerilata]
MSNESSPDTTRDLSELIAARVEDVRGVQGLHGGAFGQVGTYLPGRRVTGIRRSEHGWDIHVVLAAGAPIAATADAVRDAARAAGAQGPVDVAVEDIADHADSA